MITFIFFFKKSICFFVFGCAGLLLLREGFPLVCDEQGLLLVATHRLSCPEACGIFLEQGLNPYSLH